LGLWHFAGGNWEAGKKLYHGKATCFTCHQIHGEGHAVSPDLSNTAHRDYASVLRDLEDPNATIHPDAVAYQVTLKDGSSRWAPASAKPRRNSSSPPPADR
jgi:putative heme-binding domain-containing protein